MLDVRSLYCINYWNLQINLTTVALGQVSESPLLILTIYIGEVPHTCFLHTSVVCTELHYSRLPNRTSLRYLAPTC